jgi:hypothetical protein
MVETIAANAGSAPANQDTNQMQEAANQTGSAPVIETNNQEPQANQSTDQTGSEPGMKPLGEKGVHELITLRKRAQEAESEAAYFRGLAEGRKTESAPVKEQKVEIPAYPVPAPRIEQFDSVDLYEAAREKFIKDSTKWEIQQEQEVRTRQDRLQQFESRWQENLRKASATIPDIERIVNSPNLIINRASAFAVKDSEAGPQIIKYLHDNPEEARRIYGLSEVASAREIGKLEIKLTTSPAQTTTTTNRISQAPDPVKPIGSTGSLITADPEKIPIDEFMAKRNQAQFQRR